MFDFPRIPTHPEPPPEKLSLEEYTRFCLFCLQNNPKSLKQTEDPRPSKTKSSRFSLG